ncbi:hypothetical protein VKY48_29450 [Endobacterium cereale]|jgi:hypothetical protein|nr:hypothetical protein [Endobacterium cereale]MEB2848547.1 hypothetical protein [Endobacterium cereale]
MTDTDGKIETFLHQIGIPFRDDEFDGNVRAAPVKLRELRDDDHAGQDRRNRHSDGPLRLVMTMLTAALGIIKITRYPNGCLVKIDARSGGA